MIFPRIYSLFRLIRPRKKIGELNCLWIYETACMTCCTNFVYSIDSASSIDYRDESLIVLRNEIGYTMTVFYDAISESITGYGLDPSNPDVYHSETFLSGESTYQEAYVYDG